MGRRPKGDPTRAPGVLVHVGEMRASPWTEGTLIAAALIAIATLTTPAAYAQDTREVTIPAGTQLRLRLETSHASNSSRIEDRIEAHLVNPVVVNGRTVRIWSRRGITRTPRALRFIMRSRRASHGSARPRVMTGLLIT